MRIPMFEMLCERDNGKLRYYNEIENYVDSYYIKCGVRQGCVLGAFFFCFVMCPAYVRLSALLGPNGALYAYSDDVYLVSDPVNIFIALAIELAIYKRVGLRIGWGQVRLSSSFRHRVIHTPSYINSTPTGTDSRILFRDSAHASAFLDTRTTSRSASLHLWNA